MTPAERRNSLAALGLVDWRLRVATPAEADMAAVVGAGDGVGQDLPVVPATVAVMPEQPEVMPKPATVVADVAADGPEQRDNQPDLSTLGWEELEAWLQTRDRRGARRAVFGTGARDADMLVVGEAPGAQEDEQGLPFVGPAGQLLDRMLAAIGRSRQQDVYITNICKFRPPGNRNPNVDEVAADWPVLERQIELMQPKLLVAVGLVAAQTLLGSTASLGRLRGRVHQYPRRELPLIVTCHPAFLLRKPGAKAQSWVDLKRIATLLRDTAGHRP